MATKAPKSKFFRVATEGATTDGRAIEAAHLQQMARTYDPAKYGARIFIEHIRGLNPEWGFRCMGDVTALRTGEVEIDGKKRVTLEAQIAPTEEFVGLVRSGQKIYSSIEIAPNFAATGEAYLTGLGVTDSPASLGTEVLTFSAQHPEASPLAKRKQDKGNIFSEAVEVHVELEDDSGAAQSLLERIKTMFTSARNSDTARFADVHAAVEEVASVAAAAQDTARTTADELTNLTQQFSVLSEETRQQMEAFATRLDTMPAETPTTRSPATGTATAILTDC